MHGSEMAKRPLVLPQLHEHCRGVVSIERLLWLQDHGPLEHWNGDVELALPCQADAEIVKRAGMLGIRRNSPLIEAFGQRQVALPVFHLSSSTEHFELAGPDRQRAFEISARLR